MKNITLVLFSLITLSFWAQQPIKVFGKIGPGHSIYEMKIAICDQLKRDKDFPNMSVVYQLIKKPSWDKLFNTSYGPKIYTELLCDCNPYLEKIIEIKKPAYYEDWTEVKKKMFKLSHQMASEILTYTSTKGYSENLHPTDKNSVMHMNMAGINLAHYRDDLIAFVQSTYAKERKAYKISFYRFFPFSEEYFLNNPQNLVYEISLGFDEKGNLFNVFDFKEATQYQFLEKKNGSYASTEFEISDEDMTTSNNNLNEIVEHYTIYKSLEKYNITTTGENMGLQDNSKKQLLAHHYKNIKTTSIDYLFEVKKSKQEIGIYNAATEKFIVEPTYTYVQIKEYNNSTYLYLSKKNVMRNWADLEGNIIFPEFVRNITEFEDGILTQDGEKVIFYKPNFDLAFEGNYLNAERRLFPEKRLIVYDGKFTLILDENFEPIIPSGTYQYIRQIGNKYYQTSNRIGSEMQYGMIDHNGTVLYPCKYPNSISAIERNGETFFKVPQTQNTFTYFVEGKRLFKDNYEQIFEIPAEDKGIEFFVVKKEGKYGLIDRKNNYIFNHNYDEIDLSSYRYNEETKDLFTIEEIKKIFGLAKKEDKWYVLFKNGKQKKLNL